MRTNTNFLEDDFQSGWYNDTLYTSRYNVYFLIISQYQFEKVCYLQLSRNLHS
jgi:hypothetical protein